MRGLATVAASVEASTRSREFVALARLLCTKGSGTLSEAINAGEAMRVSPRVVQILKDAVAAGGLSDWGEQSAPYQTIATAWVESLRGISIFETLLAGGARRAPLRSRMTAVSAGGTASAVNELSVKPLTSLQLTSETIEPRKGVGVVCGSDELFEFSSPTAESLFSAELRRSVAAAVDADFLSSLYSSVTPIASEGGSPGGALLDLDNLLDAVNIGAGDRCYYIVEPDNAKKLANMRGSGDVRLFSEFGLNGGPLMPGLIGAVSDQLPSGAVLLIVAGGLILGADVPEMRVYRQGDVALSTTPDSPETASTILVNMWQRDLRALLVERFYGFTIARSNAVAAISNANY